jgi:aldehyde:ferredoxin oxidoreductase
MILDTSISSMGSDEVSILLNNPVTLGLPVETDRNTAEGAAAIIAAGARMGVKVLMDSLPICYLGVNGASPEELAQLVRAATGWDYTVEEVSRIGLRVHHLLRSFGVRSGHTKEMDEPSPCYASTVLKGPASGRELFPVWEKAKDKYYKNMGWDVATGKPLPETLKEIDLDFVIPDLWE